MNKQDKQHSISDGVSSFENNEGQPMFLSCNKASSRCPSLHSSELPQETLRSLENLGLVLRSIHVRMKREGYDIVDGVVIKVKK